MKKYYRDCRFGQLHWHSRPAQTTSLEHPALLCLHPAPYSGAYFETVAERLGPATHVVAPDYPGYGESSPPPELPGIADYADAIADAWDGDAGPYNLLGFHTGALVAVELALKHADRVQQIILIDVPFFDRATQEKLYPKAAQPTAFSADINSLKPRWEFNLGGNRLESMSLRRALALFTQELLSADRSHWAFHAAFTYDCESRFAALNKPCEIIATQSGLLEATRNAAQALPNATLSERLDVKRAVFEEGAAVVAEELERLGASR